MGQIRHGKSTGLVGFLDAIRIDLNDEHPEIEFVLQVSTDFAALRGDVVTFLILSAVELIANAKDAVGDRGFIKVSARVRSSEPTAVLKVSNSGQLPASLGDRIFEEGVSTKGEGRGMGLAIVRRMAERFGGQVRLRQEQGVEIIVSVPVS
jgi:sensor histidine kinase regulating citrate/malate metabolism